MIDFCKIVNRWKPVDTLSRMRKWQPRQHELWEKIGNPPSRKLRFRRVWSEKGGPSQGVYMKVYL